MEYRDRLQCRVQLWGAGRSLIGSAVTGTGMSWAAWLQLGLPCLSLNPIPWSTTYPLVIRWGQNDGEKPFIIFSFYLELLLAVGTPMQCVGSPTWTNSQQYLWGELAPAGSLLLSEKSKSIYRRRSLMLRQVFSRISSQIVKTTVLWSGKEQMGWTVCLDRDPPPLSICPPA